MRKITIISASTNSRNTIETEATTLAGLKADLRKAGIAYDNMSFYEGISKTELIGDDSQLPHDVMFKGETTNNLVILLTLQNKKIKSGALSAVRKAVLDAITENNLNQTVVSAYGRNCTQVSTEALLRVLADAGVSINETPAEEAPAEPAAESEACDCPVCAVTKAFNLLGVALDELFGFVSAIADAYDEQKKAVAKPAAKNEPKKIESPFSQADLDEIVASL